MRIPPALHWWAAQFHMALYAVDLLLAIAVLVWGSVLYATVVHNQSPYHAPGRFAAYTVINCALVIYLAAFFIVSRFRPNSGFVSSTADTGIIGLFIVIQIICYWIVGPSALARQGTVYDNDIGRYRTVNWVLWFMLWFTLLFEVVYLIVTRKGRGRQQRRSSFRVLAMESCPANGSGPFSTSSNSPGPWMPMPDLPQQPPPSRV